MSLSIEQIFKQFLVVTAEIRFLTAAEGGRGTSIDFLDGQLYCPHFVLQDRSIRTPVMNGNEVTEQYVPMTFIDGPVEYTNGDSGLFRFYCPSWKHPDHPRTLIGSEFTVREGSKVVAGGIVTNQALPPKTAG